MLTLSATDLAIAMAHKTGTLSVSDETGRFGPYVCIRDEHGTIEVAWSRQEANERINSVMARHA